MESRIHVIMMPSQESQKKARLRRMVPSFTVKPMCLTEKATLNPRLKKYLKINWSHIREIMFMMLASTDSNAGINGYQTCSIGI